MPGPIFFDGERIALCTFADEDYQFVRRHANDHRLREWFGTHTPRSPEQIAGWLEADDAVHFLVCVDDEPIGHAWLFRIAEWARRGELGYWIAPEHQGEGYGSEAAACVLEYAFGDLDLYRVTARVYEGNEPSTRILEGLGFVHEGCLRAQGSAGSERLDCDLYGLLAPEFRADDR